jgi:hypothetical protein
MVEGVAALRRWMARIRVPAPALTHPLAELAAIAAVAAMFLYTAWWNGFPFLFFDSGAYILEGLLMAFVPERSPVYSIFIAVSGGKLSLWLTAWVQSGITGVAVVEFVRAVWPRTTLWTMLRAAGALAVLSSVAWFAGQIEPDFLTALIIVALFPLAFKLRQLGVVRAVVMLAIAALAVAGHPSHLGTACGLVLCLAALRLAAAVWPAKRFPKPDVVVPVLSIVLGVGLVVAANMAITKHAFVSRSGSFFLTAKLIEDGVAQRTLDDLCPTQHLRLCPYRNQLPRTADEFLWKASSPFNKIKRFAGNRAEYDLIVRHSLTHYPLHSLGGAMWGGLRQYVMFRTGDGVQPNFWVIGRLIRNLTPDQYPDWHAARQQQGEIRFPAVNVIQYPLALGAQVWLMVVAWQAVRRRRWNLAVLPAFVLLGLIGNALICGGVSGPHDRYQSRVAWVPVMVVLLTGRQTVTRALRRPVESGT